MNEGFTTRIKELPLAESDALLAFLFRHCARPDYHCRFQWRANSIAFWDNAAPSTSRSGTTIRRRATATA